MCPFPIGADTQVRPYVHFAAAPITRIDGSLVLRRRIG